jgi:hypothetical protein
MIPAESASFVDMVSFLTEKRTQRRRDAKITQRKARALFLCGKADRNHSFPLSDIRGFFLNGSPLGNFALDV